uniref:Uncharacterized protein n=1 Tax=Oryza nivara TaxID=4536 RepID=A0A0E0HYE3_ORYNI
MAAAASTTVEVSDDGDHPILRDDERGIPRSLSLLAAIVEADAARHAAAATRPAESDLVRAFRGGATPTVAIGEFLERIHAFVRLESVTGGWRSTTEGWPALELDRRRLLE